MKGFYHRTCPYCNREVITHLVSDRDLYKYCPFCGEINKEFKEKLLDNTLFTIKSFEKITPERLFSDKYIYQT